MFLRVGGGVGSWATILCVLSAWWMTSVDSSGSPVQLQKTFKQPYRGEWIAGCPGHEVCFVGYNITSPCPISEGRRLCSAGPPCTPGVNNPERVRRGPMVVAGCLITVMSDTPACIWLPNDTCHSQFNGTKWTAKVTADLWLSNSTDTGGLAWMIWPVFADSGSLDPPSGSFAPSFAPFVPRYTNLAPILPSCTYLALEKTHTEIHWIVLFPPFPTCAARKKPAWYDTLLGGTGTVLGISNTIDGEVTRTMLSNTGSDIAHGLSTVGLWMPTSIAPHEEAASLFLAQLSWDKGMWDETRKVLTNISNALNMTVCNLQVLNMKLQKERFLRVVTSASVDQWRKVWNISTESWVKVYPEKTICNETVCQGMWLQMTVTKPLLVCRYHVLPVITTNAYYFVRPQGEWFSPQTNLTYDLSGCDTSDKGIACMKQVMYQEACFNATQALCDWYVERPHDLLYQIGPHSICVATMKPHPQLPKTPFSGCLDNVELFIWNNQTFKLTNFTWSQRLTPAQWEALRLPWKVTLERFSSALNRSTLLQKMIEEHRSNVSKLKVSTLIAQNEVVHAAKEIEQESAHHWWDIFTGMSMTARQYFVPPMFILIIVLSILTALNVCVFCYVRKVKRSLTNKMYTLAYQ
ncbi:uncharacterized protein LOC130922667 [Corythoichthys intestinalis]|uniref:uncharacterized protein LOC130922667 n=1 Tax=Corythoichthys intestinalis TaxID=161448 RepID=UPI0025A5CAE7|nr:uncharacterized protein LOC130922667 [Corythoichthys intestinalis]